MECKTCEEYVLAELDLLKHLLERIQNCVSDETMSPSMKITYINDLLNFRK